LAAAPSSAKQSAGKSELNRLHHYRRISTLRLADQQVHVLRHDHIADNYKSIFLTHGLEHGKKKITSACGAEPGAAMIAATGDVVQIT
jgi:hypothetical protein